MQGGPRFGWGIIFDLEAGHLDLGAKKELAMSAILPRTALFSFILCILSVLPSLASGAVERRKFSVSGAYLIVEVLRDDLLHFELSAVGSGPPLNQALYTSPMVHKTNYTGPSTFVDSGDQLETANLRLIVNTSDLCVEI